MKQSLGWMLAGLLIGQAIVLAIAIWYGGGVG